MKLKLILLFIISFSCMAKGNYDNQYFSQIPVLAGGRIKPIDTFARTNLLLVFGKSKLKEIDAVEWIKELLFDPPKAYNRKIFLIRNNDVSKALSLEVTKEQLYTFLEVSTGIQKESKLINQISQIPQKERSPSQQQIFEMYFKVSNILDISRSLSLIWPQFQIPSKEYADRLNLPFEKNLTYLQVLKRKAIYTEIVKEIFSNKNGTHNQKQTDLLKLGRDLERVASDNGTRLFRIIPPQFNKTAETEWNSPWQTVQSGAGNPATVKYFKLWSKLYLAYHAKDLDYWQEASKELYLYSNELSKGMASQGKLKWEVKYNKIDFFTKSITFYILSFLLLSFSWLFWKRKLEIAAFTSLAIGSIVHITGLTLRCIIMDRPPVTTLYESIIFVSLICVLGAVFIERKTKTNMGTFIGSCLGTILLFISFSYEKDGDSMGMLAAVLDTNFWLATHVVTITIGYGCCFVASILGHVYIFERLFKNEKENGKFIIKNMHGACLFSLFFTVLGTILGGIWADQSWGRFWGWDPKENGAMLICMWLLFAVHGRLTKYFDDLAYATTVALTSIIVVLAWFGVNLLNVGLHSYGFTTSIATNIAAFTIIELLVCGISFIVVKRKKLA